MKKTLSSAYCIENLNELTSFVITCHRRKQSNSLKRICNIVNDYFSFADANDNKLFSKLIMLYHPDKISEFQSAIGLCSTKDNLQHFAHIFPVLEIIQKLQNEPLSEILSPADFEEEYGWNYQSDESDYYMVREDDDTVHGMYDETDMDNFDFYANVQMLPEGSFIEAVKRKIYGPMHINFPCQILEDMEEIEMAEYEIEYLDGVEYCCHVTVLDLSYNQIDDITLLNNCAFLQELYMPGNQISYIDSLSNLIDLRVLDLSSNNIADIAPLFNLKALEFVNLLDNPVSPLQISKLKSNGVVVVF